MTKWHEIHVSVPRPALKFRWRFFDDLLGDHWSEWHTVEGECAACCCNYPRDGEHAAGGMSYDDDGILTSSHSWLDPDDLDPLEEVEWAQ